MWGLLGRVFGTEVAISKGIDAISNGLDKLVYTDEEKADDASKDRAEARGMLVRWLEASQGQNLARRLIALVVTGVWLFMYLLSAALDISVIWISSTVTAQQVAMSAALIGERATQMNGAMMLILGFYFAATHLGKIVGPALEMFKGKKQ